MVNDGLQAALEIEKREADRRRKWAEDEARHERVIVAHRAFRRGKSSASATADWLVRFTAILGDEGLRPNFDAFCRDNSGPPDTPALYALRDVVETYWLAFQGKTGAVAKKILECAADTAPEAYGNHYRSALVELLPRDVIRNRWPQSPFPLTFKEEAAKAERAEAPAKPKAESWIDWHSGDIYSVDGGPRITVSVAEGAVLKAFRESQTLSTKDLCEMSDQNSAVSVLKRLAKNYRGAFAAAIEFPGVKSRGYTVRVRGKCAPSG